MVSDQGWQMMQGDAWIEASHKQYDQGPDVILSVHRTPVGFELRSSAESRTSGPADTVVGGFATIGEAREAMKKECEEWDKYIADLT